MSEAAIPPLYALADGDRLGLDRLPAAAKALADAGLRWIQLRLKSGTDAQRFDAARRTLEVLELRGRSAAPLLWIDDRADFALALPFGGVHVGQTDLPAREVRIAMQAAGRTVQIGRSCHDLEQVQRADADPDVDVVAIGPVFATRSKADAEPTVGLEGVRQARGATAKPLVAIGGLNAATIPRVRQAGADCCAVLSAWGDEPLEIARRAPALVRAAESST
ncbi:MAG: thiamine phosphate synthase [Acidobacteriota bacterium]